MNMVYYVEKNVYQCLVSYVSEKLKTKDLVDQFEN